MSVLGHAMHFRIIWDLYNEKCRLNKGGYSLNSFEMWFDNFEIDDDNPPWDFVALFLQSACPKYVLH